MATDPHDQLPWTHDTICYQLRWTVVDKIHKTWVSLFAVDVVSAENIQISTNQIENSTYRQVLFMVGCSTDIFTASSPSFTNLQTYNSIWMLL